MEKYNENKASNQGFLVLPDETKESGVNGQAKKDFFEAAITRFGSIMSWQEGQTLRSWSDNLLEQLVPFVGGLQATLFYRQKEKDKLVFTGGYAIDFMSEIPQEYKLGEGLIGQVAVNQSPLILKDHNDFAALTSIKKIRLKCILVMPLVYNERTIGVIEINFPQLLPGQQQRFLFQISDSIATNLHALLKEEELAESYKKLQSSEERLNRIAEVSSEGIVFLDDQRKIVESNAAFQKIVGLHEKEIEGKGIENFLELKEEEVAALSDKMAEDIPYEAMGKHQDGSDFVVELQAREAHYHDEYFHIVQVRDITKIREAEANLKDKEAELLEAQKIVQLSNIIKKKNKDITASINYAKRIQDALLPRLDEIQSFLPESFVFNRPRDIVSGDFYWFSQIGQKLVIAVIDCTGHGVPGAIMAMAGNVFLNQIVNLQGIYPPDEILTHLHLNISRALKQTETRNRDGMDIALCTIDLEKREIEFSGAKNPLIYIQNSILNEVEGDKLPVGGYWNEREEQRIFRKKTIQLSEEPAFCYLFTDGYPDQFGGPKGRKFMRANLEETFLRIHEKPASEQKVLLERNMDAWMKEERQIDDMLILGFKI